MKRILFICLVFIYVTETNAQFVNIPDANFVSWLNANGFASCMNGNLLDISCPAVTDATAIDCSNSSIANLSGIQYFYNVTWLSCRSNLLTSLPPLPLSLESLECNFNQLTSLNGLPASLTYLRCGVNQLTSLPSLPQSLTYLDCTGNALGSLPSLPPGLEFLLCLNCQLPSLPPLPSSLTWLNCDINQLTSLPTLPPNLQYLSCVINQLTSLPNLPASIRYFYCNYNQLSSLPLLPTLLEEFECYNNQLTSIPVLPSSVRIFRCTSNLLASVPTLPAALRELDCGTNQLTALPNLPNLIHMINCSNNQITSLPGLPDSLQDFVCFNNQLTSLPVLPDSLRTLSCNGNNLTSIPALPSVLNWLVCSDNQLATLPSLVNSLRSLRCGWNPMSSLPSLPSKLSWLECQVCQLTSLPSLPDSLIYLDCSYNQLTYIPELSDSLGDVYINNNPSLACFPKYKKIQHLYWTNTAISCRQGSGTIGFANPSITALPVCTPPAAIITPAGPVTFCSGGSVILNANTGAGFTYKWIKNGSAIVGATNQAYSATTSGNYAVEVTHNCGFATSSVVTVTVNSLPSATITPSGSTTFCPGENVILNVPTGANKTYQWKKGGVNIAGATLSSYSATMGGNYKVTVTNTVTGCSKTTTTGTVVTVNPAPAATITPQGPTTFCAGNSVLLKGNSGTGLTYQWKKGGNNIAGATNKNYTATLAGVYKVKVTNSNGCSKLSTGVTVTVPCREEETVSENIFDVKVFPNPSSGDFVFEVSSAENGKTFIEVFDAIGKLILSEQITNSRFTIYHAQLTAGMYSARVSDGESGKVLKLIKTR